MERNMETTVGYKISMNTLCFLEPYELLSILGLLRYP